MYHQTRFTLEKIARRLELIAPLVYRNRAALDPFRLLELPDPLVPPPLDAAKTRWAKIEPNSYWGEKNLNFALSGAFRVPPEFDHAAHAALYLPLGESGDFSHPEALVYVDGEAYAAVDRQHQEILLPARWRDGKEHRLPLHGWTGLLGGTQSQAGRKLFMGECQVVQIDQPTRDFVVKAGIALGTAQEISADDPAYDRLLNALDAAFKILDTREPFGDDFYTSVKPAQAALETGIAEAGAPLDVQIVATGHAHIDVAWLWTLGQTRRKAGRTFHNVLRLMEQFPDYHFYQSQPQLIRLRARGLPGPVRGDQAARQRWALGADWRHVGRSRLQPQRRVNRWRGSFCSDAASFREHFGENAESRVLWLPDVFGYAWALPQLIKQAGLDYFFTIKIGWNQYNRMPYDWFWWQGLDGTRVLTHFSTTPEANNIRSRATYNAEITPRTALGTWLNFQQKAESDTILMSFG